MKFLTLALLATFLMACNEVTDKTNSVAEPPEQPSHASSQNDTIPKVTGIGGIFFFQIILKN